MFAKYLISQAAKTVAMAAILLLQVGAAFGQDGQKPSQPLIEDVYLARDDGSGKAGDVVTAFAASDIPIHCVVVLNAASKVKVKMNFVAVAVPGVKPDTKVVSATYTTSERQNRVNFTGRPDGQWTPGRYRVDIFLGGRPEKQLEFNIRGTAVGPVASKFVPATKPKFQGVSVKRKSP